MDQEESAEVTKPEIFPRYFLHMAYDGTAYHGWQRQVNGHTVQAELEHHLSRILRQSKVATVGCGRTDAGVHARSFYLHFDAERVIENEVEVLFRLNQVLPYDLAVYQLFRVKDKAHARYDAIRRTYEYHIHQRRDPFIQRWSTYYAFPLDLDAMNECARSLFDYSDFASFCKSKSNTKTTICTIYRAEWKQVGNKLIFTVSANRFLRNMVRALVGTMREVGKGKMDPAAFRLAIEGRDRALTGDSMLPQGLHLVEVLYPEGYFEAMPS